MREGNHTYQGGSAKAEYSPLSSYDERNGRESVLRGEAGPSRPVRAESCEVGPNDFSALAAELNRLIELEDRLFTLHHELTGHVGRITGMSVAGFGNMPDTDDAVGLLQHLTVRVERLQVISAIALDNARQLRHI